jgi:hypothetical protein
MRQHVLDDDGAVIVPGSGVDIDASARQHGVTDDDMTHALRYHWRGWSWARLSRGRGGG